jgi:hypothetical protein
MSQPRAFIIQGHDSQTLGELTKFLKSVGIEVIPFFRAPSEEGGIEAVLPKVLNGIKDASIVIVLFTPEEQSNFHDPRTGAFRAHDDDGERLGGWQPRPNVILEAGIAVATAENKTVLVKIGPVRIPSDLAGILFVDLDKAEAKESLLHALKTKLGGDLTISKSASKLPGNFNRCRRPRWEYHDELGDLETRLGYVAMSAGRSLLDTLRAYVMSHPSAHHWSPRSIAMFIYKNDRQKATQEVTNAAFWHLLIFGVFAFVDIDPEGDGWSDEDKELWWFDMLDHVELTGRGRALVSKIKTQSLP